MKWNPKDFEDFVKFDQLASALKHEKDKDNFYRWLLIKEIKALQEILATK